MTDPALHGPALRLRAVMLLALGLPAAVPMTAHAQGATEPLPALTSIDDGLETVTVYARRLTPLDQVAATVTVIDAGRIEETLASNLRDMIRYEPGLAVRNDPFRFGLDTISIRGLGGNRVAVEIDGIPAAPGFAVGSYADSGRAFLDPAFIERAEILRGPASALYGSDAIGGIVAISSWSPRSLLDGSGGAGLRASAGYDDVDGGRSLSVLGAAPAGTGAWLLGYARREADEMDTAADVCPDPRRQTSDGFIARYVVEAAPGGPLTLAAEGSRLRQDSSVDAFLGTPGRFANTTALLGDDEMQRGRASVEQRLGAAGGAFDSALWRAYWQATRTEQDTWEERRAVPPRTPAVQLERRFEFDEDRYGVEFAALRGRERGALRHDLSYGVEVSQARLEELRDGLQTTLPSGETTNVILGESFPLRDLPLTTVTEAGIYLQDQLAPAGDAGRWTLVPALRVDWYRLSPRADRIFREDNPATRPVAVDEVSVSPKLGATYRATDALTLFAQYAHGYRSPPPEDVNIGLDLPQFQVRAVPNPGLRPEQSDGFEVGVRLGGEALSGSASAFQTEYRDFIESKVNLGKDPATGYTLFQSQNVAEARVYGAELAAAASFGHWWPSLDGFSGRLAAAWARGRDLVRDVPLNSVDPPRAVLGLRYDAPAGRWGAEAILTAVEAQREVDRSRADLYRTDGYATLDLLGRLQLAPGLRVNVGLFNLTGEQYIEWTDVRGRTVGDPLLPYYTRPGFNASIALRYDF
jgi:hemoglobin/transferrin/lactoferrin receptor protein